MLFGFTLSKVSLLAKSGLGLLTACTSATLGGVTYHFLFGPDYTKEKELKNELDLIKDDLNKNKEDLEKKTKEARSDRGNAFSEYFTILKQNVKTKAILDCLEEEIGLVEEGTNRWFYRYYGDPKKCK